MKTKRLFMALAFICLCLCANGQNGINKGHEYVDLGLSVKWATCNVGANTPEEYGDYYAWGETSEKSSYTKKTYKWWDGSYRTQTKYCIDSGFGTVDNKTVLEPEDDVAHVKWGGSWRMPTISEKEELIDNCTWSRITQNGVNGYKITSQKNGNSIFLPAAGGANYEVVGRGNSGGYWLSSLCDGNGCLAYLLNFYVEDGLFDYFDSNIRCGGHSVRPVCTVGDEPELIDENRANQENSSFETYLKGASAYNNGDYVEAVNWFRKAAEQGLATAQYDLGCCYYNGTGVPRSYREATEWFRKAAEQGHVEAQYNLGICYANEEGVPLSYSKAAEWFRKAAEQGYASAQFNLGTYYYNGTGVPMSHSDAVKWYRKAAEQGFAEAQYNLACCYYNGTGVPRSYSEAVLWLRKAAEQGFSEAQNVLEQLGY